MFKFQVVSPYNFEVIVNKNRQTHTDATITSSFNNAKTGAL